MFESLWEARSTRRAAKSDREMAQRSTLSILVFATSSTLCTGTMAASQAPVHT